MKITPDLFEAFLKCPTKCWLRAVREPASGNTYAEWVKEQNEAYRVAETARLLSQTPPADSALSPPAENFKAAKWRIAADLHCSSRRQEAHSSIPHPATPSPPPADQSLVTSAATDQGCVTPIGFTAETQLHAVERVPSEGRGKAVRYIPIRFIFRNKLTKDDKLLLAFDAFVLSEVLGEVGVGRIMHGDDHATLKVKTSGLAGEVRKRLEKIAALLSNPASPDLVLNRHCAECEYQTRCRQKALEKDDLSLLAGMSEKERSRHRSKGIFTLTQLSYTFRPRRVPKRAKNPAKPHYFSLQALAIRENTVYINGIPKLPDCTSQVYLDVEGVPDRGLYYLIGALIVSEKKETFHSFWADTESDQTRIFAQFTEAILVLPDFRVFHFGDYDAMAMKRVALALPDSQRHKFDSILRMCVNVLAVVHAHCYFPVASNGLKGLAKFLGGEWTHPDAAGSKSLIWRREWEADKNSHTKATLLQYNKEDCLNLKRLCDFIRHTKSVSAVNVANTDQIRNEAARKCLFATKRCVLDDLQYITKCAYFDYQREKVFFRTHPHLKPITRPTKRRRTCSRPNQIVHNDSERCPRCRSKMIEPGRELSYTVLDLRFSKGHVKKWVSQHTYWDYRCLKCQRTFNPVGRIQHTEKYGLGLMSWCVYSNVLRGQNMLQINKTLWDAFNVVLQDAALYRFKGYVAATYQHLYDEILKAILSSPVLHIDETVVNLRKTLTGYVWVVTSMELVYYFYKPSREGSFLEEMLRPFSGVMVSDFFTAYDALPCQQQKCLLHLVRDIDDDLLRNPLDGELKCIAQEFGSLLRTIIATVDQYGLKKRYLHKHKPAVYRFLKTVSSKELSSELANKYKKRFQKSGTKMFTFLDHNGVPWNNTNAEHAIKLFAKYRRNADGRFTEQSLKEYLVLASVFESCEFNDVNVLKFLLARETTLDGLMRLAGRRTERAVYSPTPKMV
jgi:predicted RecB family nuclease